MANKTTTVSSKINKMNKINRLQQLAGIVETKIVPKQTLYAIINYGWNNNPDQPAYYIIADTKQEMLRKINNAIKYISLTQPHIIPQAWEYTMDNLGQKEQYANTFINDDWAIVTDEKDYFESIMKLYPTRPQQFQAK